MARLVRIHPLGLILVLGLLNGLLYTFLVPPWQHYDEPTHFEYAWLLANRSGLPKQGDYDQSMRRAVATSMIEHKFFRGMNFLPDLEAQNEPIWIGISQLDDFPLYYLLASLPMRLISSWDVTRQLYAGRLVSLCLYLVSIVAAWGVMKELIHVGHPLRWMVPISIALLPGYADLMTALNNDVGAAMIFSLFLWGGVRIIQRGFTFMRLLWVVSTALLCCYMKTTVFLALPLLGLILLFTLFRSRWRWLPWVTLTVILFTMLVSIFSWGDALLWIRFPNTLQENPTHVLSSQAPLGKYVLQLEIAPNEPPPRLFQLIPTDQLNSLRGKTVTLGGWVWATEPLSINGLTLFDGQQSYFHTVQIGKSPTFFALSTTIAEDASRVWVVLAPASQKDQETYIVYYDALVLVEGLRPLETAPIFNDPSAQQGIWAGQEFTNLLRNASGENAGPWVRPWVEKITSKYFSIMPSPARAFGSLFDWRGAGWYYREILQNFVRTFWAKFGWGQVSLSLPFTGRPYRLLVIITLVGLGGAVLVLLRQRSSLPWNVLLFFSIVLFGIWGQTILRGTHSITDSIFIPGARYTYPAIIPTMLVLNVGWLELVRYPERWLRLPSVAKYVLHFLLFLGLDIAASSSIVKFYSMR
jgi:hypothetical protein